MNKIPIPKNEQQRLERLVSYEILDTSFEKEFDDLTKLVSEICEVPICLISLIDENRQWFKSRVGLDVPETPRNISFCQHAIMQEQLYEVNNAQENPLFADNPLVVGDPKIRFYAGMPLSDKDGFNLGTVCVIDHKPRELNELQKKALNTIANTIVRVIELRHANQRRKEFGKFFHMSLDLLCIAGTDAYFKVLNPAFSDLLGWSEEELLSKPFLDFVHPDDVPATLEEVKKLSSGAPTIGFENRYKTKDNKWVHLHWTCQPDEETGNLFAVAHNISQIKQAKEFLEISSRAKDTFLANISHEIRTPLNAIIGFSDLLKEKGFKADEQKYIDAISIASKNLNLLINNILDLSKIEDGKIELEYNPINVKEILTELITLYAQTAKSKDLKLLTSIDAEIPMLVQGDAVRLMQILSNLLGNAIKFTPEGKIELKVYVDKIVEDQVHLSFTVADTGIGIAQDKLDKIFDRFTQAEDSTTREHGGTGLGLSIAKSLVELHNGKISVSSIVNKGTEFSFKIKYKITSDKENRLENSLIEHQKLTLNGLKILIVEDNEHNQILASTYIRRNNGEFDLAINGKEAITLLKKNNYDCILMDLQMPIMDGFQATQVIRNELKLTLPIIACTAHSLIGEKNKSMEVGMNEYITKPYQEEELILAIRGFLNNDKNKANNKDTKETRKDDFMKIIKDLEDTEGKELAQSLIAVFNKRIPQDILEIKNALQKEDQKNIRKKAHLIAGSLTSLNLNHGAKLARRAFEANDTADFQEVKLWTNKLIVYLNEALSTYKDYA